MNLPSFLHPFLQHAALLHGHGEGHFLRVTVLSLVTAHREGTFSDLPPLRTVVPILTCFQSDHLVSPLN